MKRIFALILAAMLLCVLTACNKEPAATTQETVDRESLANVQLEREAYVIGIVMAHCGLSEDQINVLSLNHYEDTQTVDFFFLHGEIEYMYTVNYETGEIVSYSSNVSTPPAADDLAGEEE